MITIPSRNLPLTQRASREYASRATMPRREDTARRPKSRAAASAPAPAPANALQEQVPGEEELAKNPPSIQNIFKKEELAKKNANTRYVQKPNKQ